MQQAKVIETNLQFAYSFPDRPYTDMIVIHHTGSEYDYDFSAAKIHEIHLNNDWAGIGYHFVVRKNGDVERGRPVNAQGAHVGENGVNRHSIGIHLSGEFGLGSAVPTQEQIESTALLIANLCEDYNIPINRSHIVGHKDVGSTDCPGIRLYNKIQTIIDRAIFYATGQNEISAANVPEEYSITDNDNVEDIAILSRKYETGGNVQHGVSSVVTTNGDIGGTSYGTYQLASNTGSVDEFIKWLQKYPDDKLANYGRVLSQYPINSADFKFMWHEIGTIDWGNFGKLQDEFIKQAYYNRAAKILAENYYHIEKHSNAMKATLFSRSVQNGVGRILDLFTRAVNSLGYANLSYVDSAYFDGVMINAIYDFLYKEACNAVNHYDGTVYRSENDYVHAGLNVVYALQSRYKNEKVDALQLLITPLTKKEE